MRPTHPSPTQQLHRRMEHYDRMERTIDSVPHLQALAGDDAALDIALDRMIDGVEEPGQVVVLVKSDVIQFRKE